MSEEPMIERVKKLMALALNNPNPLEAEAAMVKAKELMQKHAIDEAKLRGKDAPVPVVSFVIDLDRRLETWMQSVYASIANIYDAACVIGTRYGGKNIATFICAEYEEELLRETLKFATSHIFRESAKITKGRTVADSFRSGAAMGFHQAVMTAKPAPLTKPGTAIVLSRHEAVQDLRKELFPKAGKISLDLTPKNKDAYAAGFAVGSRMSTGKASKKLEE